MRYSPCERQSEYTVLVVMGWSYSAATFFFFPPHQMDSTIAAYFSSDPDPARTSRVEIKHSARLPEHHATQEQEQHVHRAERSWLLGAPFSPIPPTRSDLPCGWILAGFATEALLIWSPFMSIVIFRWTACRASSHWLTCSPRRLRMSHGICAENAFDFPSFAHGLAECHAEEIRTVTESWHWLNTPRDSFTPVYNNYELIVVLWFIVKLLSEGNNQSCVHCWHFEGKLKKKE